VAVADHVHAGRAADGAGAPRPGFGGLVIAAIALDVVLGLFTLVMVATLGGPPPVLATEGVRLKAFAWVVVPVVCLTEAARQVARIPRILVETRRAMWRR
jgi:hypothetical protein